MPTLNTNPDPDPDPNQGGAALSAEPDLKALTTSAYDTFVLLASDGLWDTGISDHQVRARARAG